MSILTLSPSLINKGTLIFAPVSVVAGLNVLVADASSLLDIKPEWKGYFHKILLDAPCSGLGTLARHPDARWRMSREKVDQLVSLQSKLLEGLLPLLGPRGRIVYSTCTIHPDENEHQINNLLAYSSKSDPQPSTSLTNTSVQYGSPITVIGLRRIKPVAALTNLCV